MSMFRFNRVTRFLVVHAVISIAVCALILYRYAPILGPPFEPFTIAFAQTFLGSLAGALLGIVQMVIGLFKGFAGAGGLAIAGKMVPMPVVAGVAALFAFFLLWMGMQFFTARMSYVVFILCSGLLIYSSSIYFGSGAENGTAMTGYHTFFQKAR